jgi:hypothetical protein
LAVFVVSVGVARAQPAPATATPAAKSVVFLGLRPLKKANGDGDIPRLGQAQQIRATIERVLADASHETVLGHSQVALALGKAYLVKMMACKGQLPCLAALAQPFEGAGSQYVITGEYYEDHGYHFHLFRLTLPDGKVEKETSFVLSSDDLDVPEKWRPQVESLVATAVGRIAITINVDGALCRVDGDACHFESDNKTLTLPVGDHELEVTKDGYTPEKVPVTIEPGQSKPIAVSLKRSTSVEGALRVPPAIGRRSPRLTVVRTDSPPKIDGVLDDLAWQKAWVDPNFTQNFPDEGKAASERTEVAVLYDDEAIYVAVHCFDSQPDKISQLLTRRDRDIDTDKVAVDISSKNDRTSAYHFQVSAAGTQVDALRFNDTDMSTDWDAVWFAETSIDAQGWSAEFKIPLSSLRYEGDTTSFGFQVRRYLHRRDEIDEWSYVPRTAKGEVSYYGTIEDITGLNAKRLFQFIPYESRVVTWRRRQDFNGFDTSGGNLGADIKIGLTPALTLDGTINPDFGTVEVDQVILNLTTVETYLPEKRPFFLEGADLFAMPFQVFYSRRVGAVPPDPTLVADETQTAPTPTGRIWSALKLTGLLTPRLSIGLIDAVTAREDVAITRTDPADPTNRISRNLLVEPLTNFAVLRLRQQIGSSSSIGLIGTAVNRFEPVNAAAPFPDQLCPVPYSTAFTTLQAPVPQQGRCTNDAYVGGVDTTLRTDDGEWGASGQVIGSLIENGPTRLIPDGTLIGSGSNGVGVISEAGRYGGEHWLFHIGYSNASPALQINDAGFLGSANFHKPLAALAWRTATPIGYLQQATLSASVSQTRDWKFTDVLATDLLLELSVQLKNFWTLKVDTEPYWPRWVENRETQDGARTQRTTGNYGEIAISTDPRSAVVLGLDGLTVTQLRGRVWQISGSLSLRPSSALELALTPTYNTQSGNPRAYHPPDSNPDGSSTYWFADLSAESLDLTLRGTYAFTPKLSLQAYLQPFFAAGHYGRVTSSTVRGIDPLLTLESFHDAPAKYDPTASDFREGTINLNVFLRWEFRPLSALWFVYTHSSNQTPYSPTEGLPMLRFDRFSGGPATDLFLVKASYVL